MVTYPTQLTSEEKSLRKRYNKLQEKTKELKLMQQIPGSSSKSEQTQSSVKSKEAAVTPKDARQAAKKLLEAGKLSIVNKKASLKISGFKKVGEGNSRGGPLNNPAPKQRQMLPGPTPTGGGKQALPPFKPKPVIRPSDVKQLYSRFVKASDSIKEQKIPKLTTDSGHSEDSSSTDVSSNQTPANIDSFKDYTVYVAWRETGLTEDAVREAFLRFGGIRDIKLRGQKNECFVTFQSPNIANTVQKEMNRGMIHGSEIWVEPASKENGYIELPPDVEDQPWARISAGMMDSSGGDGVSAVNRKRRHFQSYEQDF